MAGIGLPTFFYDYYKYGEYVNLLLFDLVKTVFLYTPFSKFTILNIFKCAITLRRVVDINFLYGNIKLEVPLSSPGVYDLSYDSGIFELYFNIIFFKSS